MCIAYSCVPGVSVTLVLARVPLASAHSKYWITWRWVWVQGIHIPLLPPSLPLSPSSPSPPPPPSPQAGHACGDDIDIVNGLPTGCVRVSFGYMSTYKEANMFLQFLRDCFLNNSSHTTTDSLLYQVQSPPLMPTASPSNTITSADNTSCNALSVSSIITAHTPTGIIYPIICTCTRYTCT